MGRDGCQVQLPAEILDQIFQLLPSRDLRSVVQVCRFWREVGEAPGLWSWGVVCLARGNMSLLQEVLGARRTLLVRRLRVLDWEDMPEETVEVVVEHPGLRLLDLRGVGLSSATSSQLARLVTGLQEVWLGYSPLASSQAAAILAGVDGGSKLRRLKMSFTDLSTVEPGLLAGAVSWLEEVDLSSSQLTLQQTQAVLRAAASSRQLKKLDLAMNDSLPAVKPELLASAVLNLEEFSIGYSPVSCPQIEAIFSAISRGASLKVLKIGYNRMIQFPDERVELSKNMQGMINLLHTVKRKSFLSNVNVMLLDAAFYFGYYHISMDQEWYKIVKIDYFS